MISSYRPSPSASEDSSLALGLGQREQFGFCGTGFRSCHWGSKTTGSESCPTKAANSSRAQVADIIPQPDHRTGQLAFVAEHAQARRAEVEQAARRWFEPEPACDQHAQDVPARKKQHVLVE